MQEVTHRTHSGSRSRDLERQQPSTISVSALISPYGSEDSLTWPVLPPPRGPAGPHRAAKGCLGSGPVTFL